MLPGIFLIHIVCGCEIFMEHAHARRPAKWCFRQFYLHSGTYNIGEEDLPWLLAEIANCCGMAIPFEGQWDKLTPDARSWNMGRIRSKGTSPELAVRRFLHHQGLRFRLHCRDLPGKPDIVFPGRRACIFVHGCFGTVARTALTARGK